MALGSTTPRFFYSLSGGFQNQHQKGEHSLLRLAGSRQTNTTWQIGNSARLRVFSKGRVCAEAVKMSLSHTSFSFERIPAVVTGSFASTSHPRWLPAGCRGQGAGGDVLNTCFWSASGAWGHPIIATPHPARCKAELKLLHRGKEVLQHRHLRSSAVFLSEWPSPELHRSDAVPQLNQISCTHSAFTLVK